MLTMNICSIIIVASIFVVQAVSLNNQILHMCMANETLKVQVLTGLKDNVTCHCEAVFTNHPNIREDYTETPGIGWHKLHRVGKTWNEARKICREENGELAIINSKAEEAVLLGMLKNVSLTIVNTPNKRQALLGIHDLFDEGEWVTIFGDTLFSTGFAEWSTEPWGPQPDNLGNNQNCGTLVLSGGLDDVNCRDKFAFFCELPYACPK